MISYFNSDQLLEDLIARTAAASLSVQEEAWWNKIFDNSPIGGSVSQRYGGEGSRGSTQPASSVGEEEGKQILTTILLLVNLHRVLHLELLYHNSATEFANKAPGRSAYSKPALAVTKNRPDGSQVSLCSSRTFCSQCALQNAVVK
jgi:hypothetical protein